MNKRLGVSREKPQIWRIDLDRICRAGKLFKVWNSNHKAKQFSLRRANTNLFKIRATLKVLKVQPPDLCFQWVVVSPKLCKICCYQFAVITLSWVFAVILFYSNLFLSQKYFYALSLCVWHVVTKWRNVRRIAATCGMFSVLSKRICLWRCWQA